MAKKGQSRTAKKTGTAKRRTAAKSGNRTNRAARSSRSSAGRHISVGPIHLAMRRFIDAVDKMDGADAHVLEARERVSQMLADLPPCRSADDPACQSSAPPPDCRFVPVAVR